MMQIHCICIMIVFLWLLLILQPHHYIIITHYYNIITYYYTLLHHYYIIITSLLHHYYIIITCSIFHYCLVITILLHCYYVLLLIHYYLLLQTHYYVLLRHYYILLRYYYVIITPLCKVPDSRNNGSIITHYYIPLFVIMAIITHYDHYYSLLLVKDCRTCRCARDGPEAGARRASLWRRRLRVPGRPSEGIGRGPRNSLRAAPPECAAAPAYI